MQREYGRLSLAGTVLSKRKLKEWVEKKIVRGWDDPRLYTLIAIRRRGVPPGAILEFVNELGVTTTNSMIQIARFEQTIRRYLERTVPRLMLVLDPVRVVIEDADEFDGTELTIPFSSKNAAMGDHKIKFTKTIYIDRSDFREVDSKDYFRLAPGKTVGLLQAPFPIRATSFTTDAATGKVTEIRAVFDRETKKPKTFIQWVGAEGSGARACEVRVYNPLFKSDNPYAVEGGYLNDLNPDSEVVYPDARIEAGFDEVRARAPWPEAAGEDKLGKGGPESVRFQAMRVAYFVSSGWRGGGDYGCANVVGCRLWTRTAPTTRSCSTASSRSRRIRRRADPAAVLEVAARHVAFEPGGVGIHGHGFISLWLPCSVSVHCDAEGTWPPALVVSLSPCR